MTLPEHSNQKNSSLNVFSPENDLNRFGGFFYVLTANIIRWIRFILKDQPGIKIPPLLLNIRGEDIIYFKALFIYFAQSFI